MTGAKRDKTMEAVSFHLTPAERACPVPSIAWALMSVLLAFVHVMVWVPLRGPLGLHSLPVAVVAAALAWVAFFRRETVNGKGWRAFVRRAGSRLAVGAAVVISSLFAFRAAAGALMLGC
jgi:hypothetical protein